MGEGGVRLGGRRDSVRVGGALVERKVNTNFFGSPPNSFRNSKFWLDFEIFMAARTASGAPFFLFPFFFYVHQRNCSPFFVEKIYIVLTGGSILEGIWKTVFGRNDKILEN